MSNPIDFDSVQDILFKFDTDETIASAHGLLCGLLCANQETEFHQWLSEIAPDADKNNLSHQDNIQSLFDIYENTRSQLSDPTLEFELLIADQSNMRIQADTLVQWSNGFISGLGLSKLSTKEEEVLEMIKDISEVSKLDIELSSSEDNAKDLLEIIEYVRIGVLFILESLQPIKQSFVNPETLN